MSKLEITHETPSGTVAFEACLFFDDGDFPNAEVETVGYFTDEDEARVEMRKALAAKPTDVPSEVQAGNMAGWSGTVERGLLTKDEDDEWFVSPSFERDERYEGVTEYRGAR